MPISFAIPFGGSEIHLVPPIHPAALSFSRSRSHQHGSSSRNPFHPASSGSSTRYATLSNANALRLRQRAFASSNRAGSRSSRSGGMLLLHLSMLTLLPLLFDSAHGQSAYGYKRGVSSSAASNSRATEDVGYEPARAGSSQARQKEIEDAALLLGEQPPVPQQLLVRPPASTGTTTSALWHQAQVQNASAGPSYTRPAPVPPVRSSTPTSHSRTPSKKSKAKGKSRATLSDTSTESMLALQRDLTQKLEELIAGIQGWDIDIDSYDIQLERLEQLISVAHGIVTLDEKLGHSAFASLGPDVVHSLVEAAIRKTRDLQLFFEDVYATDEFHEQELEMQNALEALVILRGRFCELLASMWRDTCHRGTLAHALRTDTCQLVLQEALDVRFDGQLYTQGQPNFRMAVTAWLLLQSAQAPPTAPANFNPGATVTPVPGSATQVPADATDATDQLVHLCNLIIHTLRHGPVRAGRWSHNPRQYMDAVASYAALFESLRQGQIRDPASCVVILETCLKLPHPPRKTAPSPALAAPASAYPSSSSLRDCAPSRITSLAAARSYHAHIFEVTHAFLRDTIAGALEIQAEGALTPQKIVYCERRHVWSLTERPTDAEAASGKDAMQIEGHEQSGQEQLCSDAGALHVLLKYAFAHLRSWEIGESLYRARAKRVVSALLERHRRDSSSASWSSLRLEAEKIACQIEVLRLRSATLLRVPQQTLLHVASDALYAIAVRMGMLEPGDDAPQLSWQPGEEEMRWQVDCLLCTPTVWPTPEKLRGGSRSSQAAIDSPQDRYEVNDAIVAFIALWTATSQWETFRLFVDRFFAHRSRSREPMRARQEHEHTPQHGQDAYFREEEEQIYHSALSDSDSDSSGSLISSRDYAGSHGSSSDTSVELDGDIVNGRAWLESQAVRAAMDRWTSSPAILVAMLNGASKYGNPSLTEKIWLVACEEETYRTERAESRGGPHALYEHEDGGRSASMGVEEAPGDVVWKLPLAAYTCMLQTYAEEARKENVALRAKASKEQDLSRTRGRAAAYDEDRYVEKDFANSTLASRTTEYYRDQLRLDGMRASVHLASQTYTRLRDTQSGLVPDARFFNAAVSVFSRCSPIPELAAVAVEGRVCDRPAALEQLERQCARGEIVPSTADRALSLVMRDITNAGIDVPVMLLAHVKPAHTGWLGFRLRGLHDADTPPLPCWGEKLDYACSPLVGWLRPLRADESSRLRGIHRPRNRGLLPSHAGKKGRHVT